jgi:hypothetical protein
MTQNDPLFDGIVNLLLNGIQVVGKKHVIECPIAILRRIDGTLLLDFAKYCAPVPGEWVRSNGRRRELLDSLSKEHDNELCTQFGGAHVVR